MSESAAVTCSRNRDSLQGCSLATTNNKTARMGKKGCLVAGGSATIDTKRFYEDIVETAIRPGVVDTKVFFEQTVCMRRAALESPPVGLMSAKPNRMLFITPEMEMSINGRTPEFIRISGSVVGSGSEKKSCTDINSTSKSTKEFPEMSAAAIAGNNVVPQGLRSIVLPPLRYHGMPWVKRKRNYTDRKWEGLHDEIQDFVEWIQPTIEETNMRDYVYRRLEKVIKSLYPDALVDVFGSYKTDLYLPTSDIDIVVIGKWPAQQLPLHTLRDAIVRENIADEAQIKVIDRAAVPIIKVTDRATDIRVDISFNKVNGVQSARLIGEYLQQLRPLKPLVLVLKQFLLQRDLNEVFKGGISSYGLILLVVNFLRQHPCYNFVFDNYNTNYGVLLVEFFELYGLHFNWKDTAIRIHPYPQYISKAEIAADMEAATGQAPSYMCIEDPLERGNDIGRSTYAAMAIMQAFQNAYSQLIVAVDTCNCDIRPTHRRFSASSSGPPSSTNSSSPRSSPSSSSSDEDIKNDEEEDANTNIIDDDDVLATTTACNNAADDEGISCDAGGAMKNNNNNGDQQYVNESESYLGRILRIQPQVIEYRSRLKQQHSVVKFDLALPSYKTEAKISTTDSSSVTSRLSTSIRTSRNDTSSSHMVTSSFTVPLSMQNAQQYSNNSFRHPHHVPGRGELVASNSKPVSRSNSRRGNHLASQHQAGGGGSDTDSDVAAAAALAATGRRHHSTALAQHIYHHHQREAAQQQQQPFVTYAAESDDNTTSVVRALVSPINTGGFYKHQQQHRSEDDKNAMKTGGISASNNTSFVQEQTNASINRAKLSESMVITPERQSMLSAIPVPLSAKSSRTTHGSGSSNQTKVSKEKKQKLDANSAPAQNDDTTTTSVVLPVKSAAQQHRSTLGALPGAEAVAAQHHQSGARADSAPPSRPGGGSSGCEVENDTKLSTGNVPLSNSHISGPPVQFVSINDPFVRRTPSHLPNQRSNELQGQTTSTANSKNKADACMQPVLFPSFPSQRSSLSASSQMVDVRFSQPQQQRNAGDSGGYDTIGQQHHLYRQYDPLRSQQQQYFAVPTTVHSNAGILIQPSFQVRGGNSSGMHQQQQQQLFSVLHGKYLPVGGPPAQQQQNPTLYGFSQQQQQQQMAGNDRNRFGVTSPTFVQNEYVSYAGGDDEVDGEEAEYSNSNTDFRAENINDQEQNVDDRGDEEEDRSSTRTASTGDITITARSFGSGAHNNKHFQNTTNRFNHQNFQLLMPPPLAAGSSSSQHATSIPPPPISPPTSAPPHYGLNNSSPLKMGVEVPLPFVPYQMTQEQFAAAAARAHPQQQALLMQWAAATAAAAAAAGVSLGPPRFDQFLSNAAAAAAAAGFHASVPSAAAPFTSAFSQQQQQFGNRNHGGNQQQQQQHHHQYNRHQSGGGQFRNRNFNSNNNNNNNKYNNNNKSYGGYGSDSGTAGQQQHRTHRDNNNNITGAGARGTASTEDWPVGVGHFQQHQQQQRRVRNRDNSNNNNNNDTTFNNNNSNRGSGNTFYQQQQQYDNQQSTTFQRNHRGGHNEQRQQQHPQEQCIAPAIPGEGGVAGSSRKPRQSSAHSQHSTGSAASSATTTTAYQQQQQQRNYQNSGNIGVQHYSRKQFSGKHRRDAESDAST